MEWQPIKTAPANTPVLVYWRDRYGYHMTVAERWTDGEWANSEPNGYCEDPRIQTPTHWTPIPPPPVNSPETLTPAAHPQG